MSETNNDKTQIAKLQGSAYDFENKLEKERSEEAFGESDVTEEQKEPTIGQNESEEKLRKDYEEHRNKEPQTHEYARSMDRGRDVEKDGKSGHDDPRNQQVPYAPHDSSGESKESPSAKEEEDR